MRGADDDRATLNPTGTRPRGSRRRTVAVGLAIAAALAGLALGGLVGPAVAGDAIAEFELPAESTDAAAGETVEIEVWLSSDGGYADEGIESYEFVLAVPPSVGEPTAVEPGPWLAQGEGRVNQTVTDAGPGAVHVRHERVGAENGTTGWDRVATVTISLREDAPSANATVLIADPQATLRGSDYRMRSFGDEATLVVDGGGERLGPAYEPGSDGSGDVDVRTAEDRNRTVEPAASSDVDGAGGMPGFGLPVAASAVLIVGLLGAARIARRRRGS